MKHAISAGHEITFKVGNEILLAGSGGASRIPFAIGQLIHYYFSSRINLHEAVDSPRFHVQNRKIQGEPGADWDASAGEARIWDKRSLYFGGVHAISSTNKQLEAVGDTRRFGVAAIF